MSLCYDGEKWLMVTLASIAISFTIGLIFSIAHGQNDSSSRVDKLIEDTKRENATEESYRAELIQRMQNTTCLNTNLEGIGSVPLNTDILKTSELEGLLKTCVKEGIIK
jgi:hypothetical protein